jgi:hypothetical protein
VGNKGKLTVRRGRGHQPDPADDFTASGLPTQGNGRRLEEQLTEMKRIWAGEHCGSAGGIGPEPVRPGGPELILGGSAQASFRRVRPRKLTLAYFALGPEARTQADNYLLNYYAFMGDAAQRVPAEVSATPSRRRSRPRAPMTTCGPGSASAAWSPRPRWPTWSPSSPATGQAGLQGSRYSHEHVFS